MHIPKKTVLSKGRNHYIYIDEHECRTFSYNAQWFVVTVNNEYTNGHLIIHI